MTLGKSNSQGFLFSSAMLGLLAALLSSCNPTGQTTIGQNFYPDVTLSYSNSTVTVAKPDVASGNPDVVTVYLKDTNGNAFIATNPTVVLQARGGTSTGTLSSVTNNGDGSYTASFTGANQGTATTIQAVVNGQILTSTLPTITVVSAGAPASITVVPASNNQSGTVGGSPGAPLQAVVKDSNSNVVAGAAVTWAVASGGGPSWAAALGSERSRHRFLYANSRNDGWNQYIYCFGRRRRGTRDFYCDRTGIEHDCLHRLGNGTEPGLHGQ